MRDLLSHRVRASPGRTALIDAPSGDTWTYADLDAEVDGLAGRLASLVSAGDHLGLLLDTSLASVELVHAAMRVGVRLVPLNARLAPPEIEAGAARADLDALVCEAATADAAREAVDVPVVSLDPADDVPSIRERTPASVEPAAWGLDDPQIVLFTSGTTGDPKAVVLTAGNLLASATASAFRLGVLPDDRWLLCLPIYHMGGLAPVLRSALYGTAVVVHPEFEPSGVAAAAREHGATGVSLVPTMLRRILDAGEGLDVRFVLLGGAPAPAELIDECERRGIRVHPTYGTTETASQVTTATPGEAFEHEGTVGHPLVFTDVTIVGDRGGPSPTGEVGEIVVDGPTVTPGYYDDPEATDATFGEHGFHTGDVGYRDDAGRLWVLDRLDDRIVTGGENVYPGEVVEALRSHPGVEDAAVVGLDDPEWGERVAALIVADGSVSADDLRAHCRDRLAAYKLPRTVAFADALPRTASGTVDRDAVRENLR